MTRLYKTLMHCARFGAMLGLVATCAGARAEQPLNLVVGFPAGGTVDVLVRQIAEGLRGRLHRPVVIENRPGAGGIIAAGYVKNSHPDGNTLLVSPAVIFSLYPLTMHKLPYTPSDFIPVVHIARFEYALGIGSKVPAKTAADYASLVRRDSKYGMYGAPGLNAPPQLYGQIFAAKFGLDMTTIPYPGAHPVALALLSGQIPAAVLPLGEMAKLANNGQARLIATTGAQRAASFPNVPTFSELKVPVSGYGQYVVYAPSGTPATSIKPIAQAIQAVLKTAPVKSLYSSMYMETSGQTGPALEKTLAEDASFWSAAIRANPEMLHAGHK